ncbi:MAG: RelA/SpoT family protein [Chitinivibrionales bacterium]|nr:RelA/SpoT family protein [Chitinivibrionales bacterium]MBD3394462.1 RelA/SpoT family protein [Chitinivibrionales bacterium]
MVTRTESMQPHTLASSLDDSVEVFLKRILEINAKVNGELIRDAYRFSWNAHRDQVRKSGEPFLAHPIAVALILAEQQLDSVTIAAGLLHDVLEDTPFRREDIRDAFGEEIALLVDGVTKIRTFQMKSRQERQAETFRKMLLSMAQDLRVIIIKFADRLHNLRTLNYLPPERIKDIATETLDIYAPLAHRLGMARIKWELEDLAFKYLYPHRYKTIVSRIVESRHDRETVIDRFAVPLRRRLETEKLEATVVGRPKHFYSIYRKMEQRNKPFEEIYDLLAIRVITRSIADCYHILGIIHSLWKPITDRFKDYIATPKSNGYQSLHTTVVGTEGNIIEMQIRTWEMNQIAEDGIAAHWLYKNGDGGGTSQLTKDDHALTWLKNLIEWQKDLTDSNEFLEFFKIDLFHAEIFVFTPKGDLISLPKGATVLDFAFAVHTDLGLHCIGAKVDGKIEPIHAVLRSGSTVEVLHLASKKPSINWLREVKTPKARSAVRRWLKSTGRQESIELGKKIVRTRLKKLHLHSSFTDHVPALLQHLGVNSLERLYELIGTGEIPMGRVTQYFEVKKVRQSVSSRVVSSLVDTFTGRKREVLVGNNDNLMVRFARCCNPVPGDSIVGFVTHGRGISVHRTDCSNAALFAGDEERTIRVNWDTGAKKRYLVFLEIQASDRAGLLHDCTSVLSDAGANVVEGTIHTENERVHNRFKIEIVNRNQLRQIIRKLERIKGVTNVSRTRDYDQLADGG